MPVDDLDPLERPARVLEAQRHLGGARSPAAGDPPDRSGEQLEVGVPDPGDVAAVGDPVVEREPERRAARRARSASSRRVRSTSLAPAGFLIRRIESGCAPDRRSSRPGRRPPAPARRPAPDLLGADAQALRRRDRGERVVDVVEAGQRQLDRRARPRRCGRGRRDPRCRAARSRSRRRRAPGGRLRSWGRRSGRGGRRRPARSGRGRRSGGSAWRRRRAEARRRPGSGPRSRRT